MKISIRDEYQQDSRPGGLAITLDCNTSELGRFVSALASLAMADHPAARRYIVEAAE